MSYTFNRCSWWILLIYDIYIFKSCVKYELMFLSIQIVISIKNEYYFIDLTRYLI